MHVYLQINKTDFQLQVHEVSFIYLSDLAWIQGFRFIQNYQQLVTTGGRNVSFFLS